MEFLKFLQNNAYYATTFMLYNTTFLVRLSLVDTYFGMFFADLGFFNYLVLYLKLFSITIIERVFYETH